MAIGVKVKISRVACQDEDIGFLSQEMRNTVVVSRRGNLQISYGHNIFVEE